MPHASIIVGHGNQLSQQLCESFVSCKHCISPLQSWRRGRRRRGRSRHHWHPAEVQVCLSLFAVIPLLAAELEERQEAAEQKLLALEGAAQMEREARAMSCNDSSGATKLQAAAAQARVLLSCCTGTQLEPEAGLQPFPVGSCSAVAASVAVTCNRAAANLVGLQVHEREMLRLFEYAMALETEVSIPIIAASEHTGTTARRNFWSGWRQGGNAGS